MSGLTLPVDRPTGRALLVASPGNRAHPLAILREVGLETTEVDDPYAAMTELCRRPLVYQAVILSLASLYREELAIVSAIKARFPHVELWLAHTDGRQAALAEAMRLGAAGLLAEDGLHRVASAAPVNSPPLPADTTQTATQTVHEEPAQEEPSDPAQPVLSADELRALLHEQSAVPPDEC